MALAQATATFVTVQYYLLPLCRRIAEVRGRLSLDLHHAKTGRGSDGTEAAPRSRVSELLQTTPAGVDHQQGGIEARLLVARGGPSCRAMSDIPFAGLAETFHRFPSHAVPQVLLRIHGSHRFVYATLDECALMC